MRRLPPPHFRTRESRAARALHDAPVEPCPHCGRETKTVSGGICADCWGIKDPANAVDLRPSPRTESLFDWDDDYDWYGIPSGYVYVALLLVLVVASVYVTVR
jgi:hypothetical protein